MRKFLTLWIALAAIVGGTLVCEALTTRDFIVMFPPRPAAAAGGLTTVFANGTLSGDNTTAASSGYRIAVAPVSGGSGQVRVTLQAGAGAVLNVQGIVCDHVSIGVAATAPNTAATPVELKFGGVSGVKLDTANATGTSDFSTLSFLSTDTLIIVCDQGAAEGWDAAQNGTATIGGVGNVYFKASTASWNQATVTGFSNFGAFGFAIAKVEVQ
jgi:hypothetical protein